MTTPPDLTLKDVYDELPDDVKHRLHRLLGEALELRPYLTRQQRLVVALMVTEAIREG